MTWFTADEHFGHANIIKYCDRPFASVQEMDEEIIRRHNSVVREGETVYHLGDFSFRNRDHWASRLNGNHIFLRGNHDSRPNRLPQIVEIKPYKGTLIVMCHYAMRVWNGSHFNSWQLYGHSHGTLPGVGKQMDVGVDTNDYYPYSLDQIAEIMESKEDNLNYFVNLEGVKKGLVDDLPEVKNVSVQSVPD